MKIINIQPPILLKKIDFFNSFLIFIIKLLMNTYELSFFFVYIKRNILKFFSFD